MPIRPLRLRFPMLNDADGIVLRAADHFRRNEANWSISVLNNGMEEQR